MEKGDQARAQPRPALGLRPWFAFLRRARSLRRFAFAMAGRVPASARYRRVQLSGGAWNSGPVALATTFLQRLAGIHGAGDSGLLLHTTAVHGRGLFDPLRVVHLSAGGAVIGSEVLPVNGSLRARGFWVLELPMTVVAPQDGAVLTVLPSSPG